MQCHHNAAELLLDAMKSTTSSVALESITLQHSYHLKQKDLIKNRKEQYSRVKKTLNNLKEISKDPKVLCNDNTKIQVAIYKNINEADSLLDILCNKDKAKSLEPVEGKTLAKSQETVIEELQTLNQNLHSLVEQLVTQVEVLKDENVNLKERVNFLEKERTKYLNIQVSEIIQNSNFTNLSLGSDNFSQDSDMTSGPPSKIYSSLRQTQPHFDLSAFKDD